MENIKPLLLITSCLSPLLMVAGCSVSKPTPTAAATYFQVHEQDGVWALVDAQGKRFYSVGICVIRPAEKDTVTGPKYDGLARHNGDIERWRSETLDRLEN